MVEIQRLACARMNVSEGRRAGLDGSRWERLEFRAIAAVQFRARNRLQSLKLHTSILQPIGTMTAASCCRSSSGSMAAPTNAARAAPTMRTAVDRAGGTRR